MTTKSSKVAINFDNSIVQILEEIAKQEKKSVSQIAKKLIKEAFLMRSEDLELAKLAEKRDVKGAKRIKHEDVWQSKSF